MWLKGLELDVLLPCEEAIYHNGDVYMSNARLCLPTDLVYRPALGSEAWRSLIVAFSLKRRSSTHHSPTGSLPLEL